MLGAVGDRALGGPEPDVIRIEFYSPLAGTFVLGAGNNGNYATCEQCVLLVIDEGAGSSLQFFAAEGTLSIDQAPGVAQVDVTFHPDIS